MQQHVSVRPVDLFGSLERGLQDAARMVSLFFLQQLLYIPVFAYEPRQQGYMILGPSARFATVDCPNIVEPKSLKQLTQDVRERRLTWNPAIPLNEDRDQNGVNWGYVMASMMHSLVLRDWPC